MRTQKTGAKNPNNAKEMNLEYKASRFRVVILLLIFLLIMVRFIGAVIFPDAVIIPTDVFFAFAIIQLGLLWYDSTKEIHRILEIQKKREALNEMKNKFTLITSHELRTPLAILQGYLDVIKNKVLGDLNDKYNAVVRKMSVQLSKFDEILHNLYKVSVSAEPHSIRKLESTSIDALISEAVEEVITFVKQRNQELTVKIEEGIPPVMMDRDGIKQVLLNLLLNSIRFTQDRGYIVIKAGAIDGFIKVEVEDNGIGISKEDLKHVFESFYEAQDTRKHSSGSIEFGSAGMGLGLTIAKNIVEAHKGKIWAESEEGKFSRFIFLLPKWE